MNRKQGTGARSQGSALQRCAFTAYRLLPTACCLLVLLGDVARADDPPAARRRIEEMSSAEKDELKRRQQRFARLEPAEQRRLRQLHQQLQQSPELYPTMHRYHRWLMSLSPYGRHELLELAPAERVERIKRMLDEEARIKANQPTREDIGGVFRWMEQYAVKHESRVLEGLPENARQQLSQLDSRKRHRRVMWAILQRWQRDAAIKKPPLTDADLADLHAQLTEPTRTRLAEKPPAEQWRIIGGWVHHAVRHRMAMRRFPGGPLPPDFQKKLDDFFQHKLPKEQQDRLLSMPGDEMRRELQKMYLMHSKSSRSAKPGPPAAPQRK